MRLAAKSKSMASLTRRRSSEVNKILVAQGRPELASLSDFAKDDLKAINDALGDAKNTKGEPNVQATERAAHLWRYGECGQAGLPETREQRRLHQAPADPNFPAAAEVGHLRNYCCKASQSGGFVLFWLYETRSDPCCSCARERLRIVCACG